MSRFLNGLKRSARKAGQMSKDPVPRLRLTAKQLEDRLTPSWSWGSASTEQADFATLAVPTTAQEVTLDVTGSYSFQSGGAEHKGSFSLADTATINIWAEHRPETVEKKVELEDTFALKVGGVEETVSLKIDGVVDLKFTDAGEFVSLKLEDSSALKVDGRAGAVELKLSDALGVRSVGDSGAVVSPYIHSEHDTSLKVDAQGASAAARLNVTPEGPASGIHVADEFAFVDGGVRVASAKKAFEIEPNLGTATTAPRIVFSDSDAAAYDAFIKGPLKVADSWSLTGDVSHVRATDALNLWAEDDFAQHKSSADITPATTDPADRTFGGTESASIKFAGSNDAFSDSHALTGPAARVRLEDEFGIIIINSFSADVNRTVAFTPATAPTGSSTDISSWSWSEDLAVSASKKAADFADSWSLVGDLSSLTFNGQTSLKFGDVAVTYPDHNGKATGDITNFTSSDQVAIRLLDTQPVEVTKKIEAHGSDISFVLDFPISTSVGGDTQRIREVLMGTGDALDFEITFGGTRG
jgi:hypothetical protein